MLNYGTSILVIALLFGGLGYTFGTQWEMVSQLISDFSGLILGVVALISAAYLWRKRHQRQVIRP